MQQFELLYEYNPGHYLVPDLLPKEPLSAFTFDENEAGHIRFVLKYDFIPPSLMARFIIRMKNDVHNLDHLWRVGVELSNKSKAKAIVKADKSEKRIDICVSGDAKSKREYFSIIRHALWVINEHPLRNFWDHVIFFYLVTISQGFLSKQFKTIIPTTQLPTFKTSSKIPTFNPIKTTTTWTSTIHPKP